VLNKKGNCPKMWAERYSEGRNAAPSEA
jgi:hypothetical protein